MSHFNRAIIPVLQHEGGYCWDKADPGGETNYGICKRNYPDLDILNLTRNEAIEIYRRDYWKPYMDAMPYIVAAKLFDASVNMGHKQANKLLQRAVWVEDDGIIGEKTLTALAEIKPHVVVNLMAEEMHHFYEKLVERKPQMAVFLKGWLKRANWMPEDTA